MYTSNQKMLMMAFECLQCFQFFICQGALLTSIVSFDTDFICMKPEVRSFSFRTTIQCEKVMKISCHVKEHATSEPVLSLSGFTSFQQSTKVKKHQLTISNKPDIYRE